MSKANNQNEKNEPTRSLKEAMGSLTASSFYQKLMETIGPYGSFQKAMESLAVPANFQASFLAANLEFKPIEIYTVEDQIESQLAELGKVDDPSIFFQAFRKIPPFFPSCNAFYTITSTFTCNQQVCYQILLVEPSFYIKMIQEN